jgi:deoxyribodipyrimidine photo-lyase
VQILWFRRDLRINDSGLLAINSQNETVLPIFIFDTNILNKLEKNDKRVSFIFQAVVKLKLNLKKNGLDLAIFYGDPINVFKYLSHKMPINRVFTSIDFEHYTNERDFEIKKIVRNFEYINDNYLCNLSKIVKKDFSPYKVFTPFYKQIQKLYNGSLIKEKIISKHLLYENYQAFDNILQINSNLKSQNIEIKIESINFKQQNLENIENLELDPEIALQKFLLKISNYKQNRDFIFLNATSNLGVHLRFGTISVRKIIREILTLKSLGVDTEPFFRQLIWREFFAYIFLHFPHSQKNNFLDIDFPWENDMQKLEQWKKGTTGVPIVDAGMRELSQNGTMHNRVRMIVASFLTKDLRIDWRFGESYFASKLLDFDASSNVSSWQWSASTGTDAQPYFRVFNPYLQAKKFDSKAQYIKKWLPELSKIKTAILFNEESLFNHKITNYTVPIVNHKEEAQKTIQLFETLKKNKI